MDTSPRIIIHHGGIIPSTRSNPTQFPNNSFERSLVALVKYHISLYLGNQKDHLHFVMLLLASVLWMGLVRLFWALNGEVADGCRLVVAKASDRKTSSK